jgi:hypothetical protein
VVRALVNLPHRSGSEELTQHVLAPQSTPHELYLFFSPNDFRPRRGGFRD